MHPILTMPLSFVIRRVSHVTFFVLFTLFFLFFTLTAQAKTLSVETDRQNIEMGDIITLVVTADFQSNNLPPDFSVLDSQFQIIGSQRSNQMQYLNGSVNVTTQWHIRLTPRQAGSLQIPPFTFDQATSLPYPIEVAPVAHRAGQAKLHFLEAEVSESNPYVQQEVRYTVRFYHQGRMVSGNIRPPQFNHAFYKQLGNKKQFRKFIQGKPYQVYEWNYVFYPQKSGPLTLNSQAFTGRIQTRDGVKAVNDASKPITLNIQPKAQSFPNRANWIIAKDITVTQTWDTVDQITLGDPIHVTLKVDAEGLLANQLPNIRFPSSPDYQTYEDKPIIVEKPSAEGVFSSKTIRIALIPNQVGPFTTPSISIPWWNSQTDQLQTATIVSKHITVKSTPPVDQKSDTPPTTHDQLNSFTQPAKIEPESSDSDSVFTWLAIAFGLLWFITMLVLASVLIQKRASRRHDRETAEAELELAIATTQHRNETNIDSESVSDTKISAPHKQIETWSPYEDLETLCNEDLSPLTKYNALRNWRQKHTDVWIDEVAWQAALSPLKAHLFNDEAFDESAQSTLCASLKALQVKIKQSATTKQQKGQHLEPLYPE